MSSAVECIRDVFPQSSIKTNRVDKYPFRVTITLTIEASDGKPKQLREVWSGKQVNLYEKYPKRRRKAMNVIRLRLSELKDSLLTGRPEKVSDGCIKGVDACTLPILGCKADSTPLDVKGETATAQPTPIEQ